MFILNLPDIEGAGRRKGITLDECEWARNIDKHNLELIVSIDTEVDLLYYVIMLSDLIKNSLVCRDINRNRDDCFWVGESYVGKINPGLQAIVRYRNKLIHRKNACVEYIELSTFITAVEKREAFLYNVIVPEDIRPYILKLYEVNVRALLLGRSDFLKIITKGKSGLFNMYREYIDISKRNMTDDELIENIGMEVIKDTVYSYSPIWYKGEVR